MIGERHLLAVLLLQGCAPVGLPPALPFPILPVKPPAGEPDSCPDDRCPDSAEPVDPEEQPTPPAYERDPWLSVRLSCLDGPPEPRSRIAEHEPTRRTLADALEGRPHGACLLR